MVIRILERVSVQKFLNYAHGHVNESERRSQGYLLEEGAEYRRLTSDNVIVKPLQTLLCRLISLATPELKTRYALLVSTYLITELQGRMHHLTCVC